MPASRLKTISDSVLADNILRMRDDYGYWDQDPIVYQHTRKAHEALGRKLSSGVGEVVRRVEEDGLKAHGSLKTIFAAAIAISAEDRRSAHNVYDALRIVPEKKEPPAPKYDF
ncbi:MAG TPA: hypothetical protein VL625_06935 [Patescibacteria group bacterium]|nr:hypothetical protein [Patescibacteria group bacterium]